MQEKQVKQEVLFDNQIDLMTVEDLAGLLRKAPKTIRNMVSRREIPFVTIGRTVYFRRKSLEAWLVKKEQPCR